ncbi:MAG: fluoride efflux transporter CrcB [Planctomycetales bacterium]|nr:fluoride efflux transporter CrcB [bacterium]UNM10018.1 MAG: fluoride efflux transporter CrcB [Planctomycetales bacterium]
MTHSLLVGAGGFAGALARYWLAGFIAARSGGNFPWGILAVNVIGSFLMALLLAYLPEKFGPSETVRLLVSVGFMGSFTTFSTFSVDSYGLLTGGEPGRAILNIGLNVVLGLLAVWAAFAIARPA